MKGERNKRFLKHYIRLINLLPFEFLFFIVLGVQETSFFFLLIVAIFPLYSFKSVFSSVSELHYCTGAYRISPVDVNSRPSSCLTNFLLNGNFHHLIVVWLKLLQVKSLVKICENVNFGKTFSSIWSFYFLKLFLKLYTYKYPLIVLLMFKNKMTLCL